MDDDDTTSPLAGFVHLNLVLFLYPTPLSDRRYTVREDVEDETDDERVLGHVETEPECVLSRVCIPPGSPTPSLRGHNPSNVYRSHCRLSFPRNEHTSPLPIPPRWGPLNGVGLNETIREGTSLKLRKYLKRKNLGCSTNPFFGPLSLTLISPSHFTSG